MANKTAEAEQFKKVDVFDIDIIRKAFEVGSLFIEQKPADITSQSMVYLSSIESHSMIPVNQLHEMLQVIVSNPILHHRYVGQKATKGCCNKYQLFMLVRTLSRLGFYDKQVPHIQLCRELEHKKGGQHPGSVYTSVGEGNPRYMLKPKEQVVFDIIVAKFLPPKANKLHPSL